MNCYSGRVDQAIRSATAGLLSLSKQLCLAAAFTCISLIGSAAVAEPDYMSQARSHMEKGDAKAAAIQLKNLLRKAPMDGDARLLLGEAYLKLGDGPAAIKELERARDLHLPKERWSVPLARSYLYSGKPQAVIDNFSADSALPEPTQARLHALQGMAYISLGKPESGEVAFNRTLAIEPDAEDALLGLARIAISQLDYGTAVDHSRKVLGMDRKNTSAWILLGESQRLGGKSNDAVTAFGHAIENQPDSVQARLGRATSNIALRKYQEAQRDIDHVRKTRGDIPLALYLNGLIAFQSKNLDEAEKSLNQVVSAMPNHPPSQLLLGSIAYSRGNLETALSHLSRYTSVVPNHLMSAKLLAATYIKLKQAEQAISALKGFHKAAESDPQYLALLGSAYIQARQFDKGTELLTRAAELAPDTASIHTQLAMGHIAAGDLDDAVGELENAVDLDQGLLQADVMLVMARIRQKKYDEAIEAANTLAEKMPDNPVPQNLLAAAYLARGGFEEAERHWKRALKIDPKYMTAAINLAGLELKRDNLEAAADQYKWVLNQQSTHLGALIGLGKIAERRKDYADMRNWLEKARQRNPDAIQPAVMLSRYHVMQGKPLKALKMARAAHSSHHKNAIVLENLGQIQLAANEVTNAVASFEELARIAGPNPKANTLLGRALYAKKDFDAAERAFDKALEIAPGYLPALVAKGDLALGQKDFTKVFQVARQVQREKPEITDGFRLEGDAHFALKRYPNAIQAYKKANQLTESGVLTTRLFKSHVAAGDYDSAFSVMENWLKKSKEDAESWVLLAMAYQQQNHTVKAIAAYETAHKLIPDNAMVANNLAWMYQEAGDGRAVELAEKTLDNADNNPEILDTAGWILTQNGKASKGLLLLKQAAVQAPHIPLIRLHVAQALVETGQREEARKELKRLLSENKKFPERGDAERLLASL